ncbi:MAG: hypothetical protein NPIRA01_39800 [Nitrospirales bacterium]|nr:MAG: hypothetical protein NPIRA01_39800 [Nitrospirales bacterium]
MTILRRAQIGKAEGIDTTVKSAKGLWKAFAPTWDMVMGVKDGRISEAQYTEQYQAILVSVRAEVWDALAQQEQATLLCYCRDGWFCHTHLIIEYAVKRWPDRFGDGRDRSL